MDDGLGSQAQLIMLYIEMLTIQNQPTSICYAFWFPKRLL